MLEARSGLQKPGGVWDARPRFPPLPASSWAPGPEEQDLLPVQIPSLAWASPDLSLCPEATESDGQDWGPPQETPHECGFHNAQ